MVLNSHQTSEKNFIPSVKKLTPLTLIGRHYKLENANRDSNCLSNCGIQAVYRYDSNSDPKIWLETLQKALVSPDHQF